MFACGVENVSNLAQSGANINRLLAGGHLTELQPAHFEATVGVDFGDGDGGRTVHARAAGRAGVDEHDAVLDDLFRVVRVAEDDHVGFTAIEYHPAHVLGEVGWPAGVEDEKCLPAERAALHVAETLVAQAAICVAEHGRNGRDGAQRGEERFVADVASVQDVLDAGEQRGDPRIEMAVRVADETDFHYRYDIDFCRAATPA